MATAPVRLFPPLTARRFRRRQHPHREPQPSPSREPAGDPRGAQGAGERVHQARQAGSREGGEHSAGGPGEPARAREALAGLLQAATVAHARRAHRLAPAAPEAAIEVLHDERVAGGELPALERPHELDAAARAVGLVARREESGTGLKTEAAVDAGVECGEAAAPVRGQLNRRGHRFRRRPRWRLPDRRSAAARPPAGPPPRGTRRSGPRRAAGARARVRR